MVSLTLILPDHEITLQKRKHIIDRYFPKETFFRDLDSKELFIHETCLQLSMMNL